MINISRVLYELGVDEWVIRGGTPTSEVEFNEMFRKITGRDDIGTAIESDNPSDFGVTWDQIVTKQAELQTDYDAKKYQRDRLTEYPSIEECIHAILDDDLEALQAKRLAVKAKYPKPE